MCDVECKLTKINKIMKMFDNTSFFQLYGTQVFICIFLVLFQIIMIISWSIKKNMQYYKENWTSVRCLPHIMPIAGYINKPKDSSVISFTQENYSYCNQQIIDEEMNNQFQPLFDLQVNSDKNQSASIQSSGKIITASSTSASNTQSTINSGTSKVMIVFGFLKYGYTLFMDIFSKITDVMTSFFNFTMSGATWSTLFLKILSKAIMIIITIFFILAVIPTIPLWFLIIPLFLFILYVIVYVIAIQLNDYVSIVPNAMSQFEPFTLMKKPKISLCFDENTKITTLKGIKKIKKIKTGDFLADGSMVTAIFKTLAYPIMFNLNGIIVSGDHYVYHDKWIKVKNHPDSFAVFYKKQFLYCLNTTSKRIKIKNHIFLDWDELDDKKIKVIELFLKNQGKCLEELHSVMDRGYNRQLMVKLKKGRKEIYNIQPGDILHNGSKVLALVTIKGDDLYEKTKQNKKYNLVTDTGYFKKTPDYNFIIDKLFYMSLL